MSFASSGAAWPTNNPLQRFWLLNSDRRQIPGFKINKILDFEPATQDRFTLTLQESVEMKGIIHKHDGTALSARLIATPTSGIAGRNLVVTTTTDSQGYFQLQLIDGLDYRWSIFPEDTSYAPLFLDAITAEAQEDWGAPILLPEPESLRFITGTLKANIQPNATATPIAGLQVRLLVAIEWSHQPAKAMRMAPLKSRVAQGEFEHVELGIGRLRTIHFGPRFVLTILF